MPPVPAVRPTRRQIAAAQPVQAPRAGWLSRIGSKIRGAVQPAGGGRIMTSEELARELRSGWDTDAGVAVSENGSMAVATVYRCVSIIANTMGMLPWRVYKREGEAGERETMEADHPVDVLLSRTPNRWQTPYQFKRWLGVCQCLRGNAYVFVVRKNGVPVELVPLHPDCMNVEQVGDFDVRYRYSSFYGGQQLFDSSEILHFYTLSLNGLWGLSPIAAARQAVGVSLAAEKFGARHFGKGVRPTGALKLPVGTTLSDEAIVRLREDIQNVLGGIDNSHKVALLEQGLEWQSLSMTAEEAQYIEARRFQGGDICKFFGIPPFLVGDIEKQTSWGSGIESQGIGFVVYTMQPWLVASQDTANARLFVPGDEDDRFTRFDTDSLTRADIGTLSTALKTQIDAGIINPNEARHRLGLNPRTDGAGDDFVVPGKSIDSKGGQPGAPAPARSKQGGDQNA
jgi:HK97 family phage portal protein